SYKKKSLLRIYLERLFEIPLGCLLVTYEPKCWRNVRLYKIYVNRHVCASTTWMCSWNTAPEWSGGSGTEAEPEWD
ncbi:MAG: hypothetical protein OET79_03025, partial [Nitrospirota bacterium]|nr:hypothetical protein [Nitrospirota bacterium]